MTLEKLKSLYANSGCNKIYVKRLSPNDNSKNQVYLAGSFDILNIFPLSDITSDSSGDWKKERFKASLKFSWIGEDGNLFPAPHSQLILYPKYPEVRFSGFLTKCEHAPSELMATRMDGRILFLGVSQNGRTLGFVAGPDSDLSNEFRKLRELEQYGVFSVITLAEAVDNRAKLIAELKRIHLL